MAVAFVQEASSYAPSNTSFTATLGSNVGAGNTVMLSIAHNPSFALTPSGLGAIWTQLFQSTTTADGSCVEVWKGVRCTTGTTVTVGASGVDYLSMHIAEFSGVASVVSASGALSASATTATTATQSLRSIDASYGLLSWTDTATPTYTDSPAAWTTLTSRDNSGWGRIMVPAYRIATGSESATRQVTLSVSKDIVVASVALLAPIADTFNRADSTTSLGTTSDGNATWTITQGTWGINTNQAYISVAGVSIATVTSIADSSASLLIAAIASDAGLVFRLSDSNNYWLIMGHATPGSQGLWKVVANSFTQVSAFSVPVGSIVSATTSGSTITAKVNGVVKASLTDSFNSTATKWGLLAQATGDRLDNFSIPESVPPSFIFDNFNRTDNASSLGTTSDGNATWTVLQGGPFGISSNQAYMSGSVVGSVAYVDAGNSDTTVAVKVAALTVSTAGVGPAFRISSASNFWAVYCLNTTATLYKVVAGAFNSQGTFTVAAGDMISVVLSGASIVVKRNGGTQLTVTDSTYSTATKHGLFMEGSSTRLDDFSVGVSISPPWRPTIRSRAIARAVS